MTEEAKKSKPTSSVVRKQMKPKQWAEAEALWESGNFTLKELSERFKSVEETFSRHFARLGIKKGSKAAQSAEKVKEEVSKSLVDDAKIISARIRETKEEHYKMTTVLGKLAFGEVIAAKNAGQPYEARANNVKMLKDDMALIKMAREERLALLGLDDPDSINDDELPELMITEMTADQIAEMHQRQVQSSQEFIDEIEGVLGSSDIDDDEANEVVVEGDE